MHCRGWRSIYCMPLRPAFKGSAPINLSDRLHQVLRWALGSVEIFLSRHCPLWYGFGGGRLKWLQRMAYINTIVYPFTSLPLIAYCTLPAICLLTGKFIIPTVICFLAFRKWFWLPNCKNYEKDFLKIDELVGLRLHESLLVHHVLLVPILETSRN